MKSLEKGITLVEILITISITIIVSTLLVTIFTQNSRLFSNQQAKVTHGISSNEVINKIDDSLRGAVAIEAQYPAESPTSISGTSTLIIKLPSIDVNGNIISTSYDYTVFKADPSISTILRQTTYPAIGSARPSINQVITSDLKSITFGFFDDSKIAVSPSTASLITYSLVLAAKQVNTTVESSASGQTRLRNN